MRMPLIIGFAIAFLAVCVIGLLGLRNADQFIETQEWVSHTDEVLATLSKAFARAKGTESSVRGFVVTGDEVYLSRLAAERAETLVWVSRLEELTKDNARQQTRLKALRALIAERMAISDRVMERRRSEGFEGGRQEVAKGMGQRASEKIRAAVDEMETEERDLLKKREVESDAAAGRTKVFIGIVTGIAAFVFIGIYVVLRRFIEERQRAERELDQFFTSSLDMMAVASLSSGRLARVSPS